MLFSHMRVHLLILIVKGLVVFFLKVSQNSDVKFSNLIAGPPTGNAIAIRTHPLWMVVAGLAHNSNYFHYAKVYLKCLGTLIMTSHALKLVMAI